MTKHRSELDPIERLRAADPAAGSAQDPSSADARATLEEILMTESPTPTTGPAARTWSRAPWLLAAAALVVVAGVVGAIAIGGDDSTDDELATETDGPATDELSTEGPATDDPASSGPATGPAGSEVTSCVETYDLDTLGNRGHAFDGTVESVDGDDMTFTVEEWFVPGPFDAGDATVTLDHQGYAGMLFAPDGPALEPGTRVLVAGDDGFVWSCGFTQLHDPALADQWRNALG